MQQQNAKQREESHSVVLVNIVKKSQLLEFTVRHATPTQYYPNGTVLAIFYTQVQIRSRVWKLKHDTWKGVRVARSKQLCLWATKFIADPKWKTSLKWLFLLWLAVTVNPFLNHLVKSDSMICIAEHLTGLNLFTHSYLQYNCTLINVWFSCKLLNVEFRCSVKCVCTKTWASQSLDT